MIMLLNIKMPTIVDILTYIIMINSMLSWVEHRNVYNFVIKYTVHGASLLVLCQSKYNLCNMHGLFYYLKGQKAQNILDFCLIFQ